MTETTNNPASNPAGVKVRPNVGEKWRSNANPRRTFMVLTHDDQFAYVEVQTLADGSKPHRANARQAYRLDRFHRDGKPRKTGFSPVPTKGQPDVK